MVGFGTTNTGIVARRCFNEPEKFADCLGLDQQLVVNLATILACYRSKANIDYDALSIISKSTYRMHFTLYPWARMNPTKHKLLIHGPEVGKLFNLPLSFLAEDGQESWHKMYRKNIVGHARQDKREHRLTDTFDTAIYATDPVANKDDLYDCDQEETNPLIIPFLRK